MIGEEAIELNALLEVLGRLKTLDVLEEVEVSVGVNTSADESVPVDALQLDVGVVVLEVGINRESNVGTLDGVHVLTSHFKLVEIKVLREYLHYFHKILIITNSVKDLKQV